MIRIGIGIGLALALALATLPLPTAASARTYADTCVEAESGDTGGHIVTLLGPAAHPRIAFSWTDGVLHGPVTALGERRGATLGFIARTDAGAFRFHGSVDGNKLTGSLIEPWDGRPRPVILRAQPLARASTPVAQCPSPAPH